MANRKPVKDENPKEGEPAEAPAQGGRSSSDPGNADKSVGIQSPFTYAPLTFEEGLNIMEGVATNLNSSLPLGARVKLPTLSSTSRPAAVPDTVTYGPTKVDNEGIDTRIPGIFFMEFLPTYGVIDTDSAPANVALEAAYQYTMTNTGGNRNSYEKADQNIVVIGIENLFSLYYVGARIVGLVNRFSPLNEYWPIKLVEELGFDYKDWAYNKENAVSRLAQYASAMEQYPMPPYMQAFRDHIALNSCIFTDGDISRSQMYVFQQKYFYSYEKVDEVKGLSLVEIEKDPETGLITRDSFFKTYDRLYEALQNSTDVALIKSKLAQAWGEDMMNGLPAIGMDYVTPIGKDDSILLSIMNADIIDIDPASARVYDYKNGNMRSYPKSKRGIGSRLYLNHPELTFLTNAPSHDEIAAAYRFKVFTTPATVTPMVDGVQLDDEAPAGGQFGDALGWYYDVNTCGTEIITNARIISTVPSSEHVIDISPLGDKGFYGFESDHWDVYSIMETQKTIINNSGRVTNSYTNNNDLLVALGMLSCFDWHPAVRIANAITIDKYSAQPKIKALRPIWDVQNLVLISEDKHREYLRWYLNDRLYRKK